MQKISVGQDFFQKALDKSGEMWYDRGVTEWGVSAVGSAQHWQCWGQGFESPTLHQESHARAWDFSFRLGTIIDITKIHRRAVPVPFCQRHKKNPHRDCDKGSGAGNQSRTDDLVITNDVLYQLSHASMETTDLTIITKFFHFVKGF